jgi:hypothetical protein
VTLGENWLYHCDRRKINNRWSGGIAARTVTPKNFRVQKSAGKVTASFWGGNQHGILLIDYLPPGETTYAQYYSTLLVKLKVFCEGKKTHGEITKAA